MVAGACSTLSRGTVMLDTPRTIASAAAVRSLLPPSQEPAHQPRARIRLRDPVESDYGSGNRFDPAATILQVRGQKGGRCMATLNIKTYPTR